MELASCHIGLSRTELLAGALCDPAVDLGHEIPKLKRLQLHRHLPTCILYASLLTMAGSSKLI